MADEEGSFLFTGIDYFTMSSAVIISFLFGLYSAIFKKKSTVEEYILVNRKLKIFPVAVSIIASNISGFTMTSIPSEVYFHGSGYFYVLISTTVVTVVFNYIYLPVLHKIKVTTLYEYLEKRFDNRVRVMCSVLYVFSSISYMTGMLCLSSLTLTQVSGVNFYAVVLVSGIVTVFYTSVVRLA